jgi:hypothetical protein
VKCEIKLCPLLIVDRIESVFQTLLMFVMLTFCICIFASTSLSSSTLCLGPFVKLYDICFHTYVNPSYDDMDIFLFVILCKHGVRDDWRPTSFSFIYLAIILHRIVYKLCNAPSLSYTMKSCYSWDKHGVLTLVNKSLW